MIHAPADPPATRPRRDGSPQRHPTHNQAMTTSVRFDRLETERLIMRRWQESDRAPFAELNADPETMRFFPNTLDRTASNALIEMIETRFDRQGFGFWALEVAATGTFIGFTGLNPLPEGVPGAGGMEVGWRLAKHAWRHGYATEAARGALGVAFDNMGLPEIWSMSAVLNEPSQAVMRRLGLTETTRFDHPRIPPGDPLRPQVAYHGTPPHHPRRPQINVAEVWTS
jgi:RimJ/RimL family protein N-acetyltransferase